jgi:hypothetical protein
VPAVRPIAFAAAAILAFAAPPAPYRFSRPIDAAPGWVRLELPDDVLNACRPGLPDLRIEDETGKEIPFSVEQKLVADERRFPIENLESVPKIETIGLIDRGASPGLADALTFEIAGSEFLKPVRVQSSSDRYAWKDVATSSVFAADDVRMLTLRIPENDRRYLRFRFDDRNSEPVRPGAVVVRGRVGPEAAPAERSLALGALAAETSNVSLFAVTLPAANLGVTALRFQAGDPAFSRRVRVFERIFFRDEVVRRLVAEGVLTRTPGSSRAIDLPVDGIGDRNLEIEVQNGDSPALQDVSVTALLRETSLRFLAPAGARLRLAYGSPTARPPRYDLDRALEGGIAAAIPAATLGPVETGPAPGPPAAPPVRAVLPGPGKWASKRPIRLPTAGNVAYLDFYDSPDALDDLRVVDGANGQVPFIFEEGSHEHRRTARFQISNTGTRTVVRIQAPPHVDSTDAFELVASGPDYFTRQVTVQDEEHDQRGVTGTRTLGSARWDRQPGESAPILRVPIERPRGPQSALAVVIENGDNVPITITQVWVLTAAARIDFVFTPGERLFLLSGNDEARMPKYDFEMLAGVILSSPADGAALGPPAETGRAGPPSSHWLWLAIGITVLVLFFELSKTLRTVKEREGP